MLNHQYTKAVVDLLQISHSNLDKKVGASTGVEMFAPFLPPAQVIVNPGGAPMCAHGINKDSLIGEFWRFFSLGKSPANVEACSKIADVVENKYGCATVGCLLALHEHNISDILTECGASPGWIRSIENLTGMQFTPVYGQGPTPWIRSIENVYGQGPPPSAIHAAAGLGGRQFGDHLQPNGADQTHERENKAKARAFTKSGDSIGKILKASNKLEATLGFDRPLIDSLVTETKKPIKTRLTYNDSNAIVTYAFRLACCRNMLSCDKLVFEFWAEELANFGYPCPDGKTTWADKLKNRFKNGRKHTAKVS